MPNFQLVSKFSPTGDQPTAIAQLMRGLDMGFREQTLLGVTGSGKTFTMANVIEKYDKPTLVLAHNKTLAAQLYSEFRDFFPKNSVHYFVSYFDYYQPEAYIASSDTYIEKDSAINEEIDRLRHAAVEALLSRKDVIVVASVSCIYGIGTPAHYLHMTLKISLDKKSNLRQQDFIKSLIAIQYHRNDLAFERGNFRVRGDTIDVFPASGDRAYRLEFTFDELNKIKIIDTLTAETLEEPHEITIFPNTLYATPKEELESAIKKIRAEHKSRLAFFEKNRQIPRSSTPLTKNQIRSRNAPRNRLRQRYRKLLAPPRRPPNRPATQHADRFLS